MGADGGRVDEIGVTPLEKRRAPEKTVRRSRACQAWHNVVVRLLGPKSFPNLLEVFAEENSFKDGWYPDKPDKDDWPRARFNEANSQFGQWNEFELSHAELLDVKLHWNADFGIPEEGKTVAEALQLDSARNWIAEHKSIIYPESSHIWLASEPLENSAVEYRLLRNYEGHLITLDGIHRLVVWADLGKQTTLAFVAGKPPKT